jgi:putative transcriptional regulator
MILQRGFEISAIIQVKENAMAKIYLSRLLGERRWTQAKLAKVTGINANTISLLYNEFSDSIKFEHIDLICKALGRSISELIELDPDIELNGEPYKSTPKPERKRR